MILLMEWELEKNSTQCVICQRKFEKGGHYHTALFLDTLEDKKQNLKEKQNPFSTSASREEYCPECWEKRFKETSYDYFWQGQIPKPFSHENESSSKLNKEQIYEQFKTYLDQAMNASSEEEKNENNGMAFFLALLLERKKVLLPEKKSQMLSNKGFILYHNPKTKEIFQLLHPKFALQSIEKYQSRIQALMGSPQKTETTLTNEEKEK